MQNDKLSINDEINNDILGAVGGRIFTGIDLYAVKAEYVIGYDTYDDDMHCYILARKVNGVVEILLQNTHVIRSESDKDKFKADISKLAEYFNCEVRGC